ncbi:MAG: SDR family NAD(P)-dependent oxidoreductase [Rhizobiaceae bacterium]
MSRRELVAVVTGGSAGIGAKLCEEMLAGGYTVVCVARRDPEFAHERLHSVKADLTDAADTERAAAEIANRFNVTHFIHNAGIILPNLVEDAKMEDLHTLTQLHAGAALTFVQAFLPAMKEAGFGRIIFNSSRAALGAITRTAYSYSKAGLHGMARTWALELGPHGITANVVAPGPVLTDNFWGIIDKGSEREQKLADSLPVRRLGTVDDVTKALMYFADPDNGYVTGQTLYVCGGASIGGVTL